MYAHAHTHSHHPPLHTNTTLQICSAHALVAKWAKEPRFLLAPYTLWVKSSFHQRLAAMWPPVGEEKRERGEEEGKKGKGAKSATKSSAAAVDFGERDDAMLPSEESDSDSDA